MSEIVRPTRDGIHGREYISTAVDLGGKADVLAFDAAGRLESDGCRMIDIPLPVVLELPGRGKLAPPVRAAMARAAKKLGTLFVATAEEARGPLARHQESILLRLDEGERLEANTDLLDRVPIAEIPWTVDACERAGKLRAAHAGLIVAVRLRFDEKAVERAESLTRGGVEILHIEANLHGRGLGAANGRFLRDMIREVHLKLVEGRLRDRTTLVVWGGIGMAEHMAKAIACGADAVGVGSALMASLECRLCASCEEGFPCPVEIEAIDPAWGEKRIVNLMGSWHSQLLEVLGAMGLREVRRLRGEVGRVMFFEDLERECFGPIFGRRKGAAAAGGAPNAA